MMFSIEKVVTLFSISGVVTFSSPDPKCSHVFKGYTFSPGIRVDTLGILKEVIEKIQLTTQNYTPWGI